MSESVVLPALGESVSEGTVTRWLKRVGERVEVDEPLLEVSTDKVDTEIPSPFAGVLEEILVAEDETVEIGAPLARIGDGNSATTSAPAAPATDTAAATEAAPVVTAPETAATSAAATAPPSTGGWQAVVLPSLGESITEGTVSRWLKQVGDHVETDEPLLEVSTDKVDTEIPSPFAGVLEEILVAEDETVTIGTALARVGDGTASTIETTTTAATATPKASDTTSAAQAANLPSPPPPAARPAAPAPTMATAPSAAATAPAGYVTPIVRKLAAEHGIELAQITGTGVGGRIRKEDVLAAAKAAAAAATPPASNATAALGTAIAAPATPSPLRGTSQAMSRLRKVIASRAVASMQATAQLTTVVEADVTGVARLREANKAAFLQKTGVKLSFLPFFAAAAAEALRVYPIINASDDGETITYPATENISIAVDTERGLLTPVVRDAGDKTIAQLAQEIADLAARTRDNKLTPDELAGGTFTLTNTGSRGALFDTPLVFQPQVAILGTGAVVKQPRIISGETGDAIAIRSTVYLALSYDHRIVDGADAARFLSHVKHRLEAADFGGLLGI